VIDLKEVVRCSSCGAYGEPYPHLFLSNNGCPIVHQGPPLEWWKVWPGEQEICDDCATATGPWGDDWATLCCVCMTVSKDEWDESFCECDECCENCCQEWN